jgi:hypothetical protein
MGDRINCSQDKLREEKGPFDRPGYRIEDTAPIYSVWG